MKILVTGATGFIGTALVLKLAEQGHTVNALYRSEAKTKKLKHPNITLFKGDITDVNSLKTAMQDCQQVYHVAASTLIWTKNPQIIHELNVTATEHILQLAKELNVEKLVFTSTAGVFGPSINGKVTENTERTIDYFMDYERTKALAEAKVKAYATQGLNTVIVNPTRVYGPGPLTKTNSVTVMINAFAKGKWRVILGNGKSVGNYVYIDDVVNGHILAMQKGTSGERYILGGDNVDYLEFFSILRRLTGKNHRMFKLPIPIILSASQVMVLMAKLFGIPPMITPALVKKFNYQWYVSSDKARQKLGYQPLTFNKGAKKTLQWLDTTNTKTKK